MSNVRGLYDDKTDDPSDDEKDSNNRYVGGIGSQGGGRSVGRALSRKKVLCISQSHWRKHENSGAIEYLVVVLMAIFVIFLFYGLCSFFLSDSLSHLFFFSLLLPLNNGIMALQWTCCGTQR